MQKAITFLWAMVFMACGVAEIPESGISIGNPSLREQQTELEHQCILTCPVGTHPTSYFRSLTCGGSSSLNNSVNCEPNGAFSFPTCGIGCPSGWFAQSYTSDGQCKINPFDTSIAANKTFCQKLEGQSIINVCGLTCPSGYRLDATQYDIGCLVSGAGGSPNQARCVSTSTTVSLSSVAINPSSVPEGGGVTGRVTLSANALADVRVSLTSNSSRVSMPPAVTVLAGNNFATFNITTDERETTDRVRITASSGGISKDAWLTISETPDVRSVGLSSTAVTGPGTVTVTVTLASAAPQGGTEVTLVSNNPNAARVNNPERVTIPLGRQSHQFSVTVSAVTAQTPVTLTATSDTASSAQLIVLPSSSPTPPPPPAGGAIDPSPGCNSHTLPRNDDGSTGAVGLPFPINFFGTTYTHLFVNNNGNVTFNRGYAGFTPFRLDASTPPIIAPFMADIDTRATGSNEVKYSFGAVSFGGRNAFCVNWVNVGYYAQHADKLNSIQLLLVDRSDVGPGDFDIVMNYDKIQWETGDANGGRNGLGGVSAGAGYSAGNGQASAFFEFPGTLVNGAFLDSNPNTGLARTSRNSLIPGRHIFEVRNGAAPGGGRIAGDVADGASPANAQVDAPVQVCPAAGGRCVFVSRTSAQGRYTATGLAEGDYLVTVFPPAGSSLRQRTVGPVHLAAQGSLEVDVTLSGPAGIPPGTSLSPARIGANGVPSVYYGDPLDLVTTGCEGGSASYQVTRADSAEVVASGTMTETPAGSYTARIPPLRPVTGPARISIALQCPDGSQQTIEFDIYIDPSGTVRTLSGLPVPDAVVTLYRSDSPSGPFHVVPDGSAIMSPSNRANPDLTDWAGRFRWDVIAGYYIVRAERDGCLSASGAPYVESAVLPVPPPVTDLDLRLDCPDLEDTTPPTSEISLSSAPNAQGWHRAPVTIQIVASDERSEVQDITYSLAGAQSGQELVAGAQAEVTIAAEGTTTLTWFARDTAGNTEAPQSLVIQLDMTAPSLSCSATPGVLLRPNHRLAPVQVNVQFHDALSGVRAFRLKEAASNEPDEGLGDGDMANDLQQWEAGTADTQGLLRAERAGRGDGRVYTLAYEGADQAGNVATCSAEVMVAHDQRN
jgi:hypothetical protein